MRLPIERHDPTEVLAVLHKGVAHAWAVNANRTLYQLLQEAKETGHGWYNAILNSIMVTYYLIRLNTFLGRISAQSTLAVYSLLSQFTGKFVIGRGATSELAQGDGLLMMVTPSQGFSRSCGSSW